MTLPKLFCSKKNRLSFKLCMVLGGVSDQVPVFDQPIRKKDAQAMFAV